MDGHGWWWLTVYETYVVDANLTGRITAALTDGKYMDVRILLAEMGIRGERPKLGALCRWVRGLDVVSGLSRRDASIERSEREKELLVVLDAVLRVAGPVDLSAAQAFLSLGPIALQEVWDVREDKKSWHQVYDGVLEKWIFKCLHENIRENFSVLENTPGPLCKPPNRHPAILHASKDNAVHICGASPGTRIRHHPTVPNLSLIENVLNSAECIKYRCRRREDWIFPDAPISEVNDEESSVLVHNSTS